MALEEQVVTQLPDSAMPRGAYGGNLSEDLLSVPESLGTRTKREFSHFRSDYGDGARFGRRANPTKIAGAPVTFLHRTNFHRVGSLTAVNNRIP